MVNIEITTNMKANQKKLSEDIINRHGYSLEHYSYIIPMKIQGGSVNRCHVEEHKLGIRLLFLGSQPLRNLSLL